MSPLSIVVPCRATLSSRLLDVDLGRAFGRGCGSMMGSLSVDWGGVIINGLGLGKKLWLGRE